MRFNSLQDLFSRLWKHKREILYIYSDVYIFGFNWKIQFATFEQTELQNLSSLESLYLDMCSIDEHSLQSLVALPSLKNLSLQELNGTVPSGGKLTNSNSTITFHWQLNLKFRN